MSRFDGIECEICGESFDEDSDIVVCPDCGTPHHRACYRERGECLYTARHGAYVWKSPIENAISGLRAEEELRQQAETEDEAKAQQDEGYAAFRDMLDRVGMQRDTFEDLTRGFDKRDIYGVSEREIAAFQGTGNPFVIQRYRRLAESRRKVSLNIFAGLLLPYYQFYSRARSLGITLALVDFLFRIPSMLIQIMQIPLLAGYVENLELDAAALAQTSNSLYIFRLAIWLVTCLFYDYAYLRWMTGKIKRIRDRFEGVSEEPLGEAYYAELGAVGRPSLLRMLLDSVVVTCAMSFIFFGIIAVM